ncbi:hypothetical protein [Streptomyces sp. NBC_01013]|uniref:hypothetical protein n=1 Tax=Streptomyces sp. NBC_01013 TaxID=2903718 RepID=UPI00387026E8|nr:hypothetical protein OG538_25510 [Streptomyces sp. NBC_01013]
MLGRAVKEASGVVDRRLFITAFLPSLLFCAMLAATVTAARQHTFKASLDWWTTQGGSAQVLMLLTLFVSAALLAQILAVSRFLIVRGFEGHWTVLRSIRIAPLGLFLHRRRFTRAATDPASLTYPPPTMAEEIQPTRLGNILRAGELYPLARYGIDAVLIWPRLFHVLPERLLSLLIDARAQLELMLTVSSLSGTFSLVAGGYTYWASDSTTLFLGCLWGGAGLAWLSYRASLSIAVAYAQQIAVAFDLYRNDLIALLGEVRPSPADEHEYWERLSIFWKTALTRRAPTARQVTPVRIQAGTRVMLAPSLVSTYLSFILLIGLFGSVAARSLS